MEPKLCLILDVRTSSLEVDLRVPGNRDEFPFSQAEWSLPSLTSHVCTFPRKFQLVRENPIVTEFFNLPYRTKQPSGPCRKCHGRCTILIMQHGFEKQTEII